MALRSSLPARGERPDGGFAIGEGLVGRILRRGAADLPSPATNQPADTPPGR
jgi:hypothetical protein